MGLEEGKVRVTSSAWESHRETTLLFSKSLAGSEPALKPASRSTEGTLCRDRSPVPRRPTLSPGTWVEVAGGHGGGGGPA